MKKIFFSRSIVDKARDFAISKHRAQRDDSGKDYYGAHIKPVGQIVRLITEDDEIVAAAYLHDTLEDTKTTLIELTEQFGQKVARIVYELTREKDANGYYFPRLKSLDAILIKFVDRLSNLSRMETWDEKRRAQYIKKSIFWRKE